MPSDDIRPILAPGFSLDADIEVSYHAIAEVKLAYKFGSDHNSSRASSSSSTAPGVPVLKIPIQGSVRVHGYHTSFTSISSTAKDSIRHGVGDGLDTIDGYMPILSQIFYFVPNNSSSQGNSASISAPANMARDGFHPHSKVSTIPKVLWKYLALLELCGVTDRMPDRVKSYAGFFDWLTSSSQVDSFKLNDFPAPLGTILEHDPSWFSKWNEQCCNKKLLQDQTVLNAIRDDVRSRKNILSSQLAKAPAQTLVDVSSAEVEVQSIEFKGFHTISLAPIRVPLYIGTYLCPSVGRETYAYAMSGQTGEVHDNAERPLTGWGNMTKAFFGGSFQR